MPKALIQYFGIYGRHFQIRVASIHVCTCCALSLQIRALHVPGNKNSDFDRQQPKAREPEGVALYDGLLAFWGFRVRYADRAGT